MSEIHSIASAPPAAAYRGAGRLTQRSDPSLDPAQSGDRLELSELAERLGSADLDELRLRKIVEIRDAIRAGVYETPEKLDAAADRLLNDLLAG